METSNLENLKAEIDKRRYYTIDQTGKTDTYVRAWVMIRSAANQGVSRLSRKTHLKHLKVYMEDLNLFAYAEASDEEKKVYEDSWKEFAHKYVEMCYEDKTYGSTLWGLVPVKKATVTGRILGDIQEVTENYPANFDLQDYFTKFGSFLRQAVEELKDSYEAKDD